MPTKHYKAFISYSHDNEEFGAWLHKQLEKYKIPKRLREDYPHLPKTLYPIFRDRYELNAGDDLGIEISKALENSDALIVVCSTKSASSKWVNKEIIDFKMKHGEEKIFPIIVDGVPFAKESDKHDDSLECFPEALKYKVDSEGNLTYERTEKLASDFNKSEDGEELAKLKLIAGVLGVPFGEFYRRDEEQKRRDRNRAIGIWGFVSLIMVGLIIYSFFQWNRAERNLDNSNDNLSKSVALNAKLELEKSNYINAFLSSVKSLEIKKNKFAMAVLWSIQRKNKLPELMTIYPKDVGNQLYLSSNNEFIASHSWNKNFKLYKTISKNPITSFQDIDNDKISNIFYSNNNKIIATTYHNGRVKLWNFSKKIKEIKIASPLAETSKTLFIDDIKNILVAWGWGSDEIHIINIDSNKYISKLKNFNISTNDNSLIFTKSGKLIVKNNNGYIHIINIATGKRIKINKSFKDIKKLKIILSHSNSMFAIWDSVDNNILIYEVKSGKQIAEFKGYYYPLFSQDDKSIIYRISHLSRKMKISFIHTKKSIIIKGHDLKEIPKSINSDSGKYSIENNINGITIINNITKEKKFLENFYNPKFSFKETDIAVRHINNKFYILDFKNGFQNIQVSIRDNIYDKVYELALSKNGRFLATGSKYGIVKLWNFNGELIQSYDTGFKSEIKKIIFDVKTKNIYITTKEGISVWDILSGVLITRLKTKEHYFDMNIIGFLNKGDFLIIGTNDGTRSSYKIWDTSFFTVDSFCIPYNREFLKNIIFTMNDEKLILNQTNNKSIIWNLNRLTSKVLTIASKKSDLVCGNLVSKKDNIKSWDIENKNNILCKNNDLLVIKEKNKSKVIIYSAISGNKLFDVKIPDKEINKINFSLFNKQLLYESNESIILFDILHEKRMIIKKGKFKFTISNKSNLIVIASNNLLEIRDSESNVILTKLKHDNFVRKIFFSPTDKYLVIIDLNDKITLVNMELLNKIDIKYIKDKAKIYNSIQK